MLETSRKASFVVAAALAAAMLLLPTEVRSGAYPDLLVGYGRDHRIKVYSTETRELEGDFVVTNQFEPTGPGPFAFGPDRHLYVCKVNSHQILRFNGKTGDFIDSFVNDIALLGPYGLTWGPDGHLYVSDYYGGNVKRYDGSTGSPMGVFASSSEYLQNPAGLMFRSDGDLLVENAGYQDTGNHNILRFDGAAGSRPAAQPGCAVSPRRHD